MIEFERWLDDRRRGAARRRSRPTTRRTAARRSSCATGCSAARPRRRREYGVEIPFRPPPERASRSRRRPRRSTETDAPAGRAARGGATDGDERWLTAQLLEYHRREARPGWWWYFRRLRDDRRGARRGRRGDRRPRADGAPRRERRARSRSPTRFTFPPQQHKLRRRRRRRRPASRAARAGPSPTIDDATGTVAPAARGKAMRDEPLPRALIPGGPYDTKAQRAALRRLAGSMLAGDGRYLALRAPAPPRASRSAARALQRLRARRAARRSLVGSTSTYLFVQGPPGSGKTYRGARLIRTCSRRASASASRRRATRRSTTCSTRSSGRPREEGLDFQGLKQRRATYDERRTSSTSDDSTTFVDPGRARSSPARRGSSRARSSTATLDTSSSTRPARSRSPTRSRWARRRERSSCSATRSSSPRSRRASIPTGSGARARAPARRARDDPRGRGIFLEQTRRMHPDVCRFVSEASTRAGSTRSPSARERSTSLTAPGSAGSPSSTRATASTSAEEADAIAARDRAAPGRHVHRRGRRTRPLARTRRHGRRALQRAGAAAARAAAGGRRGRHRRQVPGPRGAGRLLLDGDARAARTSRAASSSCSRATA